MTSHRIGPVSRTSYYLKISKSIILFNPGSILGENHSLPALNQIVWKKLFYIVFFLESAICNIVRSPTLKRRIVKCGFTSELYTVLTDSEHHTVFSDFALGQRYSTATCITTPQPQVTLYRWLIVQINVFICQSILYESKKEKTCWFKYKLST